MPKQVLEEEMTAYDLSERMIYDNRIRISELDILAAKFGYFLALCHCDPKKKPKFEDFLPQHNIPKDEPEYISEEEIIAKFAVFGLKGTV